MQTSSRREISPTATRSVCRCGHHSVAHEHYRRGTECALCPAGTCGRYLVLSRGPGAPEPRVPSRLQRFLAALVRRPGVALGLSRGDARGVA